MLDPLRRLAREGWDLTIVPCDAHGLVSAEAMSEALTDRTVLVSVMAANNEVGTLNPIAAIGRLVPRARHPLPYRCHPGRRQGPARRPGRRRSIC